MTWVNVVLSTPEEETKTTVHAALELIAPGGAMQVSAELRDARSLLSDGAADHDFSVVIVDIDQDCQQVLYELGRLTSAFPNSSFVVVSHAFDESLVLQTMQAGARHFLRKNNISNELETVLKSLWTRHRESTRPLGKVVSVFSCGGGCGASTLALNLAAELQEGSDRPVLLVDLDLHYGALASYLGLKGQYGLGHLLQRSADVDRHLVESVRVSFREGLDLLLSPAQEASQEEGPPLNEETLGAVLAACQEEYGYIVIDAPRMNPSALVDLTLLSQQILLVFQLSVKDIDYAGRLLQHLRETDVEIDKILPVVNRVRARKVPLSLDDASQALGLERLYSVRNDWRRAIRAMTNAQTLQTAAPRSGIRRDIRRLAEQVRAYVTN